MKKHYSLGWILLAILLGGLMGSALGKGIGLLIPDGVVKDFFLLSIDFGFDPFTLNLALIKLTLGLVVELNVIGVIGIILAAYILRWYL
ncbi:MAG TPA: DUF4321 domain-containing protein [bacterium]|jgi:hypothetical protein|nr:DUF4321 domain-containing protein [bacterium]HNT64561.1 DUF4321 domain-containing protein [bacterium]HOX84596.1 DUF4321 domain-containing protein [bacterium]HPG45319.1 DUF4321 domain-containing protein [bacterium]HPM98962.1 DUF4321 domain-containing protein [bacterium]